MNPAVKLALNTAINALRLGIEVTRDADMHRRIRWIITGIEAILHGGEP